MEPPPGGKHRGPCEVECSPGSTNVASCGDLGVDLSREVDLDRGVDRGEARQRGEHRGIVGVCRLPQRDRAVAVGEVEQRLGAEQHPADGLAVVAALERVCHDALSDEASHPVPDHTGVDAEVVVLGQGAEDGVG